MPQYSSKKTIVAAIVANLAIAVVKVVTGALARSSAMLAEAAHSFVDAGNGALLLIGRRRGRRGPSRHHPFGHGMEVYFWSVLVAMIIFLGGGGFSIAEGIQHVIHPPPQGTVWPSYLALAASALFDGTSLVIAWREFRRYRHAKRYDEGVVHAMRASHDPTIFMVVLEDSTAVAGALVAFLGIFLGRLLHLPQLDGVASIVIGVLLMGMATFLANECRELIIGERASDRVLDDIEATLREEPGIRKVGDVRTLQLGPESILLALRLELDDDRPTRETAELTRRLEDRLRRRQPSIKDVLFSF